MLAIARRTVARTFLDGGQGVLHRKAVVHGIHQLKVVIVVTKRRTLLGRNTELPLNLRDGRPLADTEVKEIDPLRT